MCEGLCSNYRTRKRYVHTPVSYLCLYFTKLVLVSCRFIYLETGFCFVTLLCRTFYVDYAVLKLIRAVCLCLWNAGDQRCVPSCQTHSCRF